jgi:hypothetical protein
VDESFLDDPVMTARGYVATRVLDPGATTDGGFQQGDARSGEVVFTGDVSTTVSVRQDDDGRWYVVASSSDLVTLHDTGDGTVTARVEAAGELTRTTTVSGGAEPVSETETVEGGEEYTGLGYTLGRDDAAISERFVLAAADGPTGITEVSFRAGDTEAPPAVDPPASDDEVLGVWPWPVANEDRFEPFTDPSIAAREYVVDWVGMGYSTPSEFREGDSMSGEVEITGDLEATIALRQVGGEWHVEASHTPLVTTLEGVDPGSVRLEANEAGTLSAEVRVPHRGVIATSPEQAVEPGDTVTIVPPADQVRPGDVVAVRYVLHTSRQAPNSEFTVSGIGEVRVWWGSGSDARAVAETFIESVTGDDITVGEPTDHEDADVQVPWDNGVVVLDHFESEYEVVEAIGDSVQLLSATGDGRTVRGELRLAQAGTVRIMAGDDEATVRNDVDAEGTIVPFELTSAARDGLLVIVFDTDTGYTSVAARFINR